MMTILYAFLLFVLPLFVIPFIRYPYELPKVIAFEVICYIIYMLFVKKYGVKSILKTNILLLLSVVALILLSIFHYIQMPSSTLFFGNVFRLQGIFLVWHLLAFALVTSVINNLSLNWKLYVVPLLGLLLSALFLVHPLTGRAVGTLGESNALALTSVFLWPFSKIAKIPKSISRTTIIASFLTTCIIVYLSQSRAGFIALIVQLLVIFVLRFIKKPIILMGISILFIGIIQFLPLFESTTVYENRAEIWRTALHSAQQNPIIGTGFGNISSSLTQASTQLSNNIRFQNVDSAHNIFLDWLVQGGAIGLGLFILLVGYSLYIHIKRKNHAFVLMMVGILAAMSFNPSSIVGLIALFWLIGLGYSKDKEKGKMV